MIKEIEINSLCTKILLLLNNNQLLSKEDILYYIALSDFYHEGELKSKNIKNINSLGFYLNYLNESLAKLLLADMVMLIDDKFDICASGKVFIDLYKQTMDNKAVIEKIDYIYNNYNTYQQLDKIYDELTSKFILKNVKGGQYGN